MPKPVKDRRRHVVRSRPVARWSKSCTSSSTQHYRSTSMNHERQSTISICPPAAILAHTTTSGVVAPPRVKGCAQHNLWARRAGTSGRARISTLGIAVPVTSDGRALPSPGVATPVKANGRAQLKCEGVAMHDKRRRPAARSEILGFLRMRSLSPWWHDQVLPTTGAERPRP